MRVSSGNYTPVVAAPLGLWPDLVQAEIFYPPSRGSNGTRGGLYSAWKYAEGVDQFIHF